jgi:hypothetical protein
MGSAGRRCWVRLKSLQSSLFSPLPDTQTKVRFTLEYLAGAELMYSPPKSVFCKGLPDNGVRLTGANEHHPSLVLGVARWATNAPNDA